MGNKKDKKGQKSTTGILKESRSVLYGDEVEESSVLNNVWTLLNRMDTRLSTIEKNTGKNAVTLNQMNDKLNTLTARVITAESDIVHVKSRVADLEASSQGTGNLFDDVKEKTDKLSKDFEKLRKERKEDARIRTSMVDEIKKIETENVKLKEKFIDME
jgi:chromosome segregation ATPase